LESADSYRTGAPATVFNFRYVPCKLNAVAGAPVL
jgi:hypothetical protein